VQNPQILRGFRDFLPGQMMLRQSVMSRFRDVFERHGFEPIDTPVLEYFDTLTGNIDDEKLIYHFEDQGGREVGMRFDLTVPLARFVAQHRNELIFPFKRYHIAPVWRADRPQRGRFREFWQCDADVVGTTSMLADADVVSIIVEALQSVNMPSFVVRINHRKLLESFARFAGVAEGQSGTVYRAIDKLDKIGPEGVVEELERAGLNTMVAGRIIELLGTTGPPDEILSKVASQLENIDIAREAIADLSNLFSYLAALGVPPGTYELDLSLARGLGYYTGPVFEATVREGNIGSLAGAGRYDGLVGRFSKQHLPATGISLGIERIIVIAEELQLLDAPTTVSDVLVTVFDDETVAASLGLATELRAAGLKVETFLEPGKQLGQQFRYASRKGIPFAIVIGPDEAAREVIAVKELDSGDQSEIPRTDISDHIRTLRERSAR
jgi:histidyl-tRNA synthetase